MANLARADLEALLRSRQLDRTLTSALPLSVPGDGSGVLPTGLAPLDRVLGGGVPRGALSEIAGPRSSGRTSVLLALLASAIGAGELAALVDPLDLFDPASAAAAGVETRRLLWVRGEPWHGGAVAGWAGAQGGPAARARALVERGLKAFNLVLQAGGFGLVVLDLADVPVAVMGQVPWSTWFRLQRVVEGGSTVCVIVVPVPVARSAGGVTLALRAVRQGVWAEGASRLLLGLEFDARVVRARAAAEATCRLSALAGGASGLRPRAESTKISRSPAAPVPAGAEGESR